MPIIANNVIVINNQTTENVVTKNEIVSEPGNKRVIRRPPKIEEDNDRHTILVVNGKHKKISKKSQYLLDMLNLDEE